jgi:hypothetical protein
MKRKHKSPHESHTFSIIQTQPKEPIQAKRRIIQVYLTGISKPPNPLKQEEFEEKKPINR